MPIVSQQIIEDSPQTDGQRYIRYQFTDHVGGVHILGPIIVPAAFDANADILTRIERVEAGLNESEMQSFEGDPLTATFNYTTKKKVLRHLLIKAMRDENPKAILSLKPIIEWVRANYTGVQIADYLNITITQAQKLAQRFDALVLVASTLDTDIPEEIE